MEWIGNGSRPDQFLVARATSGTVTITATVRDSHQYSNDLRLQGRLRKDRLLRISMVTHMQARLAETGAVIANELNFDSKKLLLYHFFLNTAATPFSKHIVTRRK